MSDVKQNHYPSISEVVGIAREYQNAGKVTLTDDNKCEIVAEEVENEKVEEEVANEIDKEVDEDVKKPVVEMTDGESLDAPLAVKSSEVVGETSKYLPKGFFDIEINGDSDGNDKEEGEKKENERGGEGRKSGKGGKGETREKWTHAAESTFVMIAMLTQFWIFPYKAYRNGGGAYLVAYLVTFAVCGMPLFLLETIVAQYSGFGALRVWNICPLFKGVGYVILFKVLNEAALVTTMSAWSGRYLAASHHRPAPWKNCKNHWNTPECVPDLSHIEQSQKDCFNNDYYSSDCASSQTAANEFWDNQVLHISSGLGHFGSLNLPIVGIMTACCLIVFLCVFRGAKTVGKVSFVLVPLSFFLLAALLVRALSIPGATSGLAYFIYPNFYSLMSLTTWTDAMSTWVSPSGVFLVYASFNNFHNNLFKQSLAVMAPTLLFSIMSGVVTFSLLGYLSLKADVPLNDIVSSGPNLVFVVLSEAISDMPMSIVWTMAFYLLLFVIFLGALLSLVMVSRDVFKHLLGHKFSDEQIVAVVLILNLAFGIFLTFGNGIYMFTIIDFSVASTSSTVIALTQIIAFAYIYGSSRLIENARVMFGLRGAVWWKCCWWVLTPLCVASAVAINPPLFFPLNYDKYVFPYWSQNLYIVYSLVPLIIVFVFIFVALFRAKGSFIERFRQLLKPTEDWEDNRTQSTLPEVK